MIITQLFDDFTIDTIRFKISQNKILRAAN